MSYKHANFLELIVNKNKYNTTTKLKVSGGDTKRHLIDHFKHLDD